MKSATGNLDEWEKADKDQGLYCHIKPFIPWGCRDLDDGDTAGKNLFASICLVGSLRLKTKNHSDHLMNCKTYEFVCVHLCKWASMIWKSMYTDPTELHWRSLSTPASPTLWQPCYLYVYLVQSLYIAPHLHLSVEPHWQSVSSLCLKTPLCSARVLFI